jgi:Polyketide cyclase / dehydrase and lipid transport
VLVVAVILVVGSMLPKGHLVSRKIVVPAKPDPLFALISGPPDWRAVKYERLSDGKWKEDGITYERVETVAPTRIVNRIADKTLPFGGAWTYDIAPAGDGSELTITENGEVYNPVFRFVSRFVMGHAATIEKYQKDVLKKFGG